MRKFVLVAPVFAASRHSSLRKAFLAKKEPSDHHDAAVTDLAFFKLRGNDQEEVTIYDVQDDTTEGDLGVCKEAPFVGTQPEFEYFKLCGVNKKLLIFGEHKCDKAAQSRKAELALCDTKINAETCITVNSGSDANDWMGSARSWMVTGCDYVEEPAPPPVAVEGDSSAPEPVPVVTAPAPPEAPAPESPASSGGPPPLPEATHGNIKQFILSVGNPFKGMGRGGNGSIQMPSRPRRSGKSCIRCRRR